METAIFVYTIIAILVIVPIILFNIRHYVKRAPGEPARLNFPRIITISIITVALVGFFISMYNFTTRNQPQLVTERVLRQYIAVSKGDITKDEFLDKASDDLTQDFIRQVESGEHGFIDYAASVTRFQLNDIVLPKYHASSEGKKVFPQVEGVVEQELSPVFMFVV
ncbi:MAG TPA: hypothetical protein PLZ84_06390, partial [Clostridia bacterium]|nr:hypothetical protein [Clostridia bacterium]